MVCRLCLKDAVPSGSAIQLYHSLNSKIQAQEMVKLIEKYLDIEVRQDDLVSTMICQDCHGHIDEFHRFHQNVAEKQYTLHNQFLEVQVKEECHFGDNLDVNHDYNEVGCDKINADSKEIEEAMFECPIDIVKSELADETEEHEVIAPDILDASDLNKEDIFARDAEDDTPLIKLKIRKKITPKRKDTKSKTKPNEPKKKGEPKKYISAQEIIATSMELKCDICLVQVTTWKELREHFLLAHTRTPYMKCCNNIYDKQRPLADHLLWHKNPDAFKCKMCNEILPNSRDLTSHISRQHPDNVDLLENYECEHCFKQFRSFTIYKNHLRSHSQDSDVECQICNKRLANDHQLRRHMDSFHKDTSYHICDICGKKFKCKDSFKKHYQLHQGIVEPAVQCSICKKWLKNYHSLRIHRLQHEEHPRPCNDCGKMFKTQRSWKKHVKYWHEMEKNLPCSFCDKVFREKRNLDEHMATHTGAQLYTCPHCNKESRSKSNMYAHIKRQHPDEWWKTKMERLNLDPNTTYPPVLPQQQE